MYYTLIWFCILNLHLELLATKSKELFCILMHAQHHCNCVL